ncbi:MAG: choice-of-anchor D domain-containing protein [Halieaceae bacterium]
MITEASLASIAGLPDTKLAGLTLTLENLSGLTDLSGLSGLKNIQTLVITRNPSLTNLSGLSTLTSITSLEISKNDNVSSLMGLDALSTITRRLIIEENPDLVSLDGLDALSGVLTELKVTDNPQLANVRALRGVQSLSSFLYVVKNSSLNECDVFGPIATATGPSKTYIRDNGAGTACADSQQNYMTPSLVLAPASFDFGAINQGSSATLDVTVTAMGSPSTRVKLGALSITDSNNPAWFTIDGPSTCISGQNIDSGDSCIITVRVAPLGFGPDQADLRVPYLPIPVPPGAMFGPLHASLTVLGDGQPSSNLTPSTSLDFGPETIGGTSAPQTVTVTNSGNAPLNIGSITDDDPADFPLSNNCGGTLAAGATCDITVNFTPTRRGNISGTLTLNSSAAVSPQKLVLTGIGNAPAALAVNPASLDFAGVATGSSTILPATISNTGDDDLVIGQATFSNPDFSFNSDACSGQTLAAGQTCSIAVRFAPSSVATIAGNLSIASNDAASPASIPLAGIGEEPAALQASPANLNFGEVDLGSSSDLPVTLTNTGGPVTSVVINSVAANAADYTVVSDACSGQTLAGGASCALTVRFTPSVPGPDNASLVLQHSLTASSPTNVGLVGSGGTPVAYINPSSIDFGDVQINTPSAATVVTVGDASASDLAISAIVSNASAFQISNDTCTGQTVISGNTCTFEVTALPTALGGISGAISVVSDSGSSPDKVTLLANGVAAATVRVSSSSLTYTGVAVGGSATQSVTVTNSGGFDLVLGQLTVSGSTAFGLGGDSCSTQTLAPGASCTVSVDYSRTTISGDSGSLSIPSNAPQSPDVVPLSAPAIAAAKVPVMGNLFLLLLGFLMVITVGVYQGSRRA